MNQDNKREAISKVLKKLQPAMEVDGGGITDFAISLENIVSIRFKGTCLFCPSQKLTLNLGIKRTICNELPWVKDVTTY